MSSDDPKDSPALAALTELGRDTARPHTTAELDQGLHLLQGRIATDQARRRVLLRWSLFGATAGVCVVLALQAVSVSHPRAPAEPAVAVSRIEGGIILEGGYLSQSGRAGVTLFFNEGSKFELTSGTRGRLRAVAEDGAHLAVENGTAALQVTQSRQRRWLVEAGPFLVTVKGTAFTVSWDPSSERFELMLRHGRVVVSGPIVGGSIALLAGHRLVVSLPDAQTVITEEPLGETTGVGVDVAAGPATVPVRAAQAAVPKDVTARQAPPAARSSSAPARTGGPRNWAADLARGHWDHILADVDRDGVDATLTDASSEDLFALADAARYRRRTELASAALRAQRVRFPRSPRSLDAIFLLGRVEELREHGAARAITWYDHYLAQAPAGAYAAEALGRKMILTSEAGGPADARPLAAEYLRRFPAGSYAGAARALQRVP